MDGLIRSRSPSGGMAGSLEDASPSDPGIGKTQREDSSGPDDTLSTLLISPALTMSQRTAEVAPLLPRWVPRFRGSSDRPVRTSSPFEFRYVTVAPLAD